MLDIFLIKLAISFVIGGIWISAVTIIAEKAGSKAGGIIGGLPSTMVVALLFIGWTQSTEIVVKATEIIPMIMGIDALFVVAFILFSRTGLFSAVAGSLVLWAIMSLGLVYARPSFAVSLAGGLALLAASYYIVEFKLRIKSAGSRIISYGPGQIAFRAGLSGAIIVFAVFMTKAGGPLIGGMFAAFPAVFLATAILTYKANGSSFSGAVMKMMMVSGVLSVIVFSVAVRYIVLALGLAYGMIIAYLISGMSAYALYKLADSGMG